jgi:phosphatidylserine/phosphatidylglycerophosphate/cardiolipin synthase-like enzyme
MVLSKFLLYTTIGCVVFIIGAEIYHQAALALKERLQIDEELNEMIFTRDPLNYNTRLTRNIKFTREKTMHVMEMIENMILSARKSVHVAMYIFTSDPLATALIEAHKRGVQVFVVVDHSMQNASSSRIARLSKSGIEVRIFNDKTLHHKICLIDVPCKETKAPQSKIFTRTVPIPRNGCLISGSLNWTREALMNNEENFTVNSKPELCQRAAKKFFEIWNSSKSQECS